MKKLVLVILVGTLLAGCGDASYVEPQQENRQAVKYNVSVILANTSDVSAEAIVLTSDGFDILYIQENVIAAATTDEALTKYTKHGNWITIKGPNMIYNH